MKTRPGEGRVKSKMKLKMAPNILKLFAGEGVKADMAEISICARARTHAEGYTKCLHPFTRQENQRVNLHMTLHPAFTLPSPGQRARGATTAYPNTKKTMTIGPKLDLAPRCGIC